jgi:hypothetical protein
MRMKLFQLLTINRKRKAPSDTGGNATDAVNGRPVPLSTHNAFGFVKK